MSYDKKKNYIPGALDFTQALRARRARRERSDRALRGLRGRHATKRERSDRETQPRARAPPAMHAHQKCGA
eukprot:5967972-Alexandrium_andersonii.AAC.1